MATRDESIRSWIRTNYPNQSIRANMSYGQLVRIVQDLSGGLPDVLGEVPDDMKSTRIFGSIQPTTTDSSGTSNLKIGTTSTGASGSNAAATITDGKLNLTLPRGTTGTTGASGASGATGSTGADGSQGIQGIQGSQGIQGDEGSQGTAGAAGSQGIQGATGTTGSQGATGPAGLQWRGAWSSATAYIVSDVSSDSGHSYVCIVANQYRQPPNATYWELLADAGAAGPTGSTGPQGDVGTTGSQGATGSTGSQGPQGDAGSQGIQGNQGVQGTAGTTGSTGSTGAQGATGSSGLGVPAGGAAHKALTKIDATDNNTQWGGVIEFAQADIPSAPATGNIRIGAGNNSNTFAINTEHGYINMGMQNGGTWAHMKTSATYFYFHRSIQLDGGDGLYAYDGDFWVKTDDKNNAHHERLTILGGDSLVAGETRIGIDKTTPATELDVNGTIRQSATTNAIVYADANGDLTPLTIGANLTLTGNSLAASGGGGGGTNLLPPTLQPVPDGGFIPQNLNKVIALGGDGSPMIIDLPPTTPTHQITITNTASTPVLVQLTPASFPPILWTKMNGQTGIPMQGGMLTVHAGVSVNAVYTNDDGGGQPRYYIETFNVSEEGRTIDIAP